MARLDRLGPAKEVAQIAAAIGREFSHPLLAAVVSKPDAALQSSLDRLVTAGLLFRQGLPPHVTYLFKHALVQDAAYGTLLRETRRALHGRIAETLESKFTDVAENHPELLARHHTEAGHIEKAAALWGKAGLRSLAKSALREAVDQLTRALEQLEMMPASAALRREQIKLRIALIEPIRATRGFAAPEAKAALSRARELVEVADKLGELSEDPLPLFSILTAAWITNYVNFDGDSILLLSDQVFVLAEKLGGSVPLVSGNQLVGTTLLTTGEIAAGRDRLRRAISLYDPVAFGERARRTMYDHKVQRSINDPKVMSLIYLSWADWLLGYPRAAIQSAESAIERAREIDQVATLMFAVSLTALTQFLCGNYVIAMSQVDELSNLASTTHAEQWKAAALVQRGYVSGAAGKPQEAVRNLSAGIDLWQSAGSTLHVGLFKAFLARAKAELNKVLEASQTINEAIAIIEETKEQWCQAEVHRTAGEITLLSPKPNPAKAEAYFERALTVARQQQAKSWELRAAMSMARLWRDQGKRQQARELLAPVYGWFTEGFDTLDLKEAKALLDELAKLH